MEKFNEIQEAYQRNFVASPGAEPDLMDLYKSLSDLELYNDKEEGFYHLAARFADAEAIRFLSDSGLRPRVDKYGNTALHSLTATRFDLRNPGLYEESIRESARQLLEAGVNPKKKNDSGKIAYVEAGLLYLYPMLEAIGEAGLKMDATAEEGKNLLHLISEKLAHRKTIPGALEAAAKTVKILVEKSGIDVEDKDVYGTTPLTYAQRSDIKEIAVLLTGDENDADTGGMTIHEAVLQKDVEALETLISRGTDLNEQSDQYRRTPLMLACEYPSEPIVQLLIRAGADVNYTSGTGETALFFLLTKGVSNFGRGMSQDLKDMVRILRALIGKGLKLDQSINAEGDTALNLICQSRYLADLDHLLAEELIESGCDLNRANLAGKTPLISFAQKGNEIRHGIAELLLDNGADVNYTDATGNTALLYAAGNPDHLSARKMVTLLVEKVPSSTEKVNNAGQTAMDIAIKQNNEALVKVLLV